MVRLLPDHRAQTVEANNGSLIRRPAVVPSPLLAVLLSLVLAWGYGYWYAWTHASLWVHVDDVAPKGEGGTSVVANGVTLTFRDKARATLAVARAVEPIGVILAVHPRADVGNCRQTELFPPAGNAAPGDYARCFEQHSAWAATWAPRVHSADGSVGSCQVRAVAVAVRVSHSDWLLWWVPLPHIGGTPLQHVDLAVTIDSRACAAVRP